MLETPIPNIINSCSPHNIPLKYVLTRFLYWYAALIIVTNKKDL